MSCSGIITKGKQLLCSDRHCRLYTHPNMRFEGVNDAPVLHLLCGNTLLSGEVQKKVIESGPRDNRGVVLSVSIKCLEKPSEGATTCLEEGANAARRGAEGGLVITSRVALKKSSNKSMTLDPQPHLIKTKAPELIKKKQWKSIEIILHVCFCVFTLFL